MRRDIIAPMNKQALKNSEGMYVRIRPIAKRLEGGKGGIELDPIDHDWIIGESLGAGVQIRSALFRHVTTLGRDHIHEFKSDPDRGPRYGFLILSVQIHVSGDEVWIEPIRPTTT
jgi:hypothetical protein